MACCDDGHDMRDTHPWSAYLARVRDGATARSKPRAQKSRPVEIHCAV